MNATGALISEWQKNWIPAYIKREFDGKSLLLDTRIKKVHTFSGCRRSGKTYLMYQAIDELAKDYGRENVFYFNLEDERIERTTRFLTDLIPSIISHVGSREKLLIFLDEIQNIPNWDRWVRRINDTHHEVFLFISGSSSKLSAKEIPSSLRGRCTNFEVFPLKFDEFLKFKNYELRNEEYLDEKRAELLGLLEEYMRFGGFPEVVLSTGEMKKKGLVDDYFRTIVYRDIADKYNVRNRSALSEFIKLLLGSRYFSANKSFNALRGTGIRVGKSVLFNYMRYAEEVYFAFYMDIFSPKAKDRLRYPKKAYFIDNSFLSFISLKFSGDMGKLMENLVAVQLRRDLSKEVLMEMYYWKDTKGREIDFVLKEGLAVKQLIQVCYNMDDRETRERELKSLMEGSRELHCNDLLIITWDDEGVERRNGKKATLTPLWKWLLKH